MLPYVGVRPFQAGFNFTFTNVPGPNWKQYVAGYELEVSYGTLMLGGNLGMGIGLGTIGDKLLIGVTGDPRLVNVELMRDCINDCYLELQALAEKRGAEI